MTTRERTRAIANALEEVPAWPKTTAGDLLAQVATELGHEEILDRFQTVNALRSHAVPITPILHLSGRTTPASGLGSLVRGLVLGSSNLVSSPANPLLSDFLNSLPAELRSTVEHQETLPDHWLRSAAGIAAFGSDSELSTIHRSLRPGQVFQPHPESFSFAIIFGTPDSASVSLAAQDVAASLTLGETSLHNIFLAHPTSTPESFAGELSSALESLPLPPPSALPASVTDLRSSYSFRAATDPTVSVHGVDAPHGHTVIAETSPLFATVPAPGVVFVKPLPSDLPAALRFIHTNINTIAVHPFNSETISAALGAGASRVCPLGTTSSLHRQPHPCALPAFSPWVRWVDLG